MKLQHIILVGFFGVLFFVVFLLVLVDFVLA
ncbi:MAG: hypothetical protein CBC01_04390 [Betaproteobacteria bacterium TMED41]|nr:MAG: hypothetical protein CBC01_04390 [Betaproteobacteria bacterium TMED41]